MGSRLNKETCGCAGCCQAQKSALPAWTNTPCCALSRDLRCIRAALCIQSPPQLAMFKMHFGICQLADAAMLGDAKVCSACLQIALYCCMRLTCTGLSSKHRRLHERRACLPGKWCHLSHAEVAPERMGHRSVAEVAGRPPAAYDGWHMTLACPVVDMQKAHTGRGLHSGCQSCTLPHVDRPTDLYPALRACQVHTIIVSICCTTSIAEICPMVGLLKQHSHSNSSCAGCSD